MASHDFRSIGRPPVITPGCSGLVRPVDPLWCTVTVITHDAEDAVRAAGGWMLDRVRAGWRVRAVVPEGSDVRGLEILGVNATFFDGRPDSSLLSAVPATVATAAETFDHPIGTRIEALARDYDIEVAVWGEGELRSTLPFDDVRHRLSSAAATFKARALVASAPPATIGPYEFFRSSGQWYSLDSGADLERVQSGNAPAAPVLTSAQ
jgi:hypothetical protein